ncbi:thiamine pyrophosphate-dependent dehydrogenase E1 component subunit alpha [[Acholeplasma] multilocale]|uniref:thiamine pyrophosphate-dependent dehydrogenase E1 component subunit alpha n=1 Tax=[Acholeplasma] multilocale TaxID=264638 RepID=UPI00047D27BD|nr:thiamine pyrophosphate-dependent dehydrogenase E1 component subunit alpha [[Acholeplasma] multilocale]
MKYIGKFDPLKDQRVEIMDKNGKIINQKIMPKIKNEIIIEAYKLMNLSRRQDDFQNKAQRQGRLLSFLSSTGQEASEVGYAMHLIEGQDWFLSGYRNNAAWLTVGVPIRNILLYWVGNEFGAQSPIGVNSLPPNIVIGSQYSQATGIAFAEKYQNKNGVVLTTTGDGGMSEGETYEAMNFAKLHEVPCIFVSENNQWAISTPYEQQTKSLNIAVKSISSGIPSIKVDGNDFFAVYGVMQEIFEFVRKGNGSFFVELETYRLGAHSSSDNPDIYRDPEEFAEACTRDPLIRLKAWMIENGIWNEDLQAKLDEEQDGHVRSEFDWMEENRDYPVDDIFNYTYEKLTPELEEQLAEAKDFFTRNPLDKGGH